MLVIVQVDGVIKDSTHRSPFDLDQMADDRDIPVIAAICNTINHQWRSPLPAPGNDRGVMVEYVSWSPFSEDPEVHTRRPDDYRPGPFVIAAAVKEVAKHHNYLGSKSYPLSEAVVITAHEKVAELCSAMGFSTLLFQEGHKRK